MKLRGTEVNRGGKHNPGWDTPENEDGTKKAGNYMGTALKKIEGEQSKYIKEA